VLVFLSIGSRRIEYVACTSKPNTAWMLQQARNLLMDLGDDERQVRFLIHDRDAKFPAAFDALLGARRSSSSARPSRHRTQTHTWSVGSAASVVSASTGF
jgi:putative transposase